MSRVNLLDEKNIHVDSHAENDKGGSKNESEIGEKLNREYHKDFNRTALTVGTAMVAKRTNTDFTHIYWGTKLAGGQLIGEDLPPTLQFILCAASKPANIMIMAMRAERRQLEYSFAPEYV